jgi:DivIVA domain-containing protein
MEFPRTSAKIPGYDPEQVDALISRLQRQFDNPSLKLVTSSTLSVVKFDLIPGGYQIPAVDKDVARFAEAFLEREIAGKVKRGGRDEIAAELASALRQIRKVTEAKKRKAFTKAAGGYKKRQVLAILKKIDIKRGVVSEIDPIMLRTVAFGRSRSGFDRTEVDEFLSLVIKAWHCQRALG